MTKQELRENLIEEIKSVLEGVIKDAGGSLMEVDINIPTIDIMSSVDDYIRYLFDLTD